MTESNNTSPNKNTSPIDPPKKTFRSIAENLNKPNKFTNLGKAYSNNLYYNTGYGESKYDNKLNFDAQFNESNPIGSINENRAEQQSGLDHLGIGLVRAGAKAATEIAKLPGVIGGIAMSPFAEENEGLETAFNNQWIQYFDSLDEKVKEALPVYTKEAVKNGDFFDKISSSAFWAEDGADGAGFMLGMLAPGAIFKWAGGANALFGASIKAAKLAKYGEGMEAGRKALMEAGITINKIDQYMIPAFNTFSEAGSEAKGVSDDLESRKGEFMTNAITIQGLSPEEAEIAFKEQKALSMQNTFIKNVAILAVPNYIQSKMLFGKTPSKVLLDKIGSVEKAGFKQSLKEAGKRVGETFLSEGSEEVGQTSVQNRNVNSALNGKLGDSRIDDYNPLTFGSDFVKTLGTTEGQIAGFLGGIMGSPISVVTGYRQDIADRKQTERLRDKINGESTAYKDVVTTNIYEQEEYTNPETNEVSTRDKLINGEKVLIPEAVAKVKNALDLNEKQSQIYDKAVEEGDIDTVEYLKGQAEFNLISKFIGEDQVTLDALHEYLKVAFPTETSKEVSKEQVAINKENVERVDKIMKKATSLQKDLSSYKDMAVSIIRINNPEVTEEHLTDFMNRVGSTFISERAEEYEAKQVLNKLEKQRLELENNSLIIEIENPNYIEGVSSEFDKKTKTRTNNPRLELVNKQIDKVKEQLKDFEEATNSTIWDNEFLNNKISNEVKVRKKLQKESSPEQIAKNDEIINKVKEATTVEEIAEIENATPKSTIENPIIKEKIEIKKAEIITIEENVNNEERTNATQEDNDFNNVQTYDGLTATEGSIVTDELIPQQAENNTSEELKSIENAEVDGGLGVKVISTDRNTGLPLQFMSEQFPLYLEYEREPVNKSGKEVGFEINQLGNNNSILEIEKRREKELKERVIYDRKPTSEDGEFRIIGNPSTQIFRINENTGRLQIKDLQSGLWTVEGTHGKIELETAQRNGFEKIKEKINAKYDSEIKNLPQTKSKVNPKVIEALNAFNKKDFSNPKLLIDYLPLNVQFTNEVKAPIETRRVTNDINIATELLRTDLVNNLINGVPIESIKTTIQDQYKGLLKVDNNRFANNNILQLDGVKDINYIRENLYVINSFGKLQNVLNDKIFEFNNGKIKPNAAGEVYLTIPQANGKLFPLKLNIKKISESEAVLLYEIYKEIITNEKSLDTTVSEVNDDLKEAVLTNFEAELNIIGGNKNDIKLQEIIDLLIYQSANIKSQMQVVNGVLYYGDKESTIDTIEQDQNEIIDFLINSKRHQIKINPKSEIDNTKTNLKSNSADYLKYLIDNNILSTNAVVNEPTFQGYTNIYLNTGITVINQPKISESGVEVKTDNTGFDSLFGNNQENVRNVQENFLSLSEIPGTVENIEIKETQDKVFNEKRTPKQRQTDFRRMDVLFKKKQEGTLTSEKELRDFEMFKQMYPQEYEKRCK